MQSLPSVIHSKRRAKNSWPFHPRSTELIWELLNAASVTFGAPEWSHAWGSGGVLVTTGPSTTDTGIAWWARGLLTNRSLNQRYWNRMMGTGPLNITDSWTYTKTFGEWVWDFQPFLPTLKRKGILMKQSWKISLFTSACFHYSALASVLLVNARDWTLGWVLCTRPCLGLRITGDLVRRLQTLANFLSLKWYHDPTRSPPHGPASQLLYLNPADLLV